MEYERSAQVKTEKFREGANQLSINPDKTTQYDHSTRYPIPCDSSLLSTIKNLQTRNKLDLHNYIYRTVLTSSIVKTREKIINSKVYEHLTFSLLPSMVLENS